MRGKQTQLTTTADLHWVQNSIETFKSVRKRKKQPEDLK